MTDPNILYGDGGMKFIFASGDTRMVHLMRPRDGENFQSAVLSLCTANAEAGTTYQVPSGKSYYMFNALISMVGTSDIKICIQKNTVADTNSTVTGDDLYNFAHTADKGENPINYDFGGLKFDALDYVTPYDFTLPANVQWSFSCYGVECDA